MSSAQPTLSSGGNANIRKDSDTLSRVLGVPTKYVFHKDFELPPGTEANADLLARAFERCGPPAPRAALTYDRLPTPLPTLDPPRDPPPDPARPRTPRTPSPTPPPASPPTS